MALTEELFAGFETGRIMAGASEIFYRAGGEGPPLLLLHGYPQTGACWHRVAPGFARHFRCIVPDLPGYGRSGIPEPDAEHAAYSKRTTAAAMVSLMRSLGHESFFVLGHDRGARVSYRLALDHPAQVMKLGIIEVITTGDMWSRFNAAMAMSAYHWTFLAQRHPLPERMIGADPVAYLEWTLASWTKSRDLAPFDGRALQEYRDFFSQPDRIRACCEDYRAGWHVDRKHDEADREAGRRIKAPLHFVWSEHGFPARAGDAPAFWRAWAEQVTGNGIDAGHFAQEENPKGVIDAFVPFFRG